MNLALVKLDNLPRLVRLSENICLIFFQEEEDSTQKLEETPSFRGWMLSLIFQELARIHFWHPTWPGGRGLVTTSVLLKAVTVTSPKDIVAIAGDTNVANAVCIFPIQYRVFRHPGTNSIMFFIFQLKLAAQLGMNGSTMYAFQRCFYKLGDNLESLFLLLSKVHKYSFLCSCVAYPR